MKFKVGDLVKWDGHDARIGAIMQHPSRYIIEYTVRQSDISGTITHAYGRTKNVKEDELAPAETYKTELDEQIEIRVKELVNDALSFCNLVSGAINCYEEGVIKDMMKEASNKVRRNATRIMAYTDVRDSEVQS